MPVILDREELAAKLDACRKSGSRIVSTNGVRRLTKQAVRVIMTTDTVQQIAPRYGRTPVMTSVKGTYKNGWIEFAESPPYALNESEALITFLAEKQDEREMQDLYGIGKGKLPDNTDIETLRREVISDWKQEWEKCGDDSTSFKRKGGF